MMSNEASGLIAAAETLYGAPLTPGATKQIREHLESGIARASALLGNIIMCDYLNCWNEAGPQNLIDAADTVQRALNIAEDLALAHYAQGFIHRANGNHENARAAFDRSLTYNPGSVRARAQLAAELMYLGQFQEALVQIDQAIADGSGSPAIGMFNWIKGRVLFFLGEYQDAIPCLEYSIESWQDLWYNRLYLVSARAHLNIASAQSDLESFWVKFPAYATIAEVAAAEQTNPNQNERVVAGREAFHAGLALAGMPEGSAAS
jgi:tetratricopeptide (TPR) repeat protein